MSIERIFPVELDPCMSSARLKPYLEAGGHKRNQAYLLYQRNTEFCQAFYPLLQLTEIALRNRLDQVLQTHFNDPVWMLSKPPVLGGVLCRRIQETQDRLVRDNPARSCTQDMLVSASPFGLWTELHANRYEHLWHRILPQVYPHLGRALKQRKPIWQRIERIRKLRNRIFHHEPIWSLSLVDLRQDMLDILGWIEPALLGLVPLPDHLAAMLGIP